MPVFRVQVNYTYLSVNKWSNVWHVSGADIVGAADAFEDQGVPDLLAVLDNTAVLASLLVSSESDDTFVTRPINAAGTNTSSGDLLPLFNSAKILFTDGSLGRPDYKYIKGLVNEGNQTNGILTSGIQGALKTVFDGLIADMDAASYPLVSEDNDQYVESNVQPRVQMRQMHRKRKKTTPTP